MNFIGFLNFHLKSQITEITRNIYVMIKNYNSKTCTKFSKCLRFINYKDKVLI